MAYNIRSNMGDPDAVEEDFNLQTAASMANSVVDKSSDEAKKAEAARKQKEEEENRKRQERHQKGMLGGDAWGSRAKAEEENEQRKKEKTATKQERLLARAARREQDDNKAPVSGKQQQNDADRQAWLTKEVYRTPVSQTPQPTPAEKEADKWRSRAEEIRGGGTPAVEPVSVSESKSEEGKTVTMSRADLEGVLSEAKVSGAKEAAESLVKTFVSRSEFEGLVDDQISSTLFRSQPAGPYMQLAGNGGFFFGPGPGESRGLTTDYVYVGGKRLAVPEKTSNYLKVYLDGTTAPEWVSTMPETQDSDAEVFDVTKNRIHLAGNFAGG